MTPRDLTALGLSDVEEATTPAGVRLLSGDFPRGEHDEVWRTLLEDHPATGWYPVLGWSAKWAAQRASDFPTWRQGPAALAEALTIDPAEWMEMLRRSQIEGSTEELDDDDESVRYWHDHYDPVSIATRIDAVPPAGRGRYRKTDPCPPADVLLVPAAHGYEIAVLVPGLVSPSNWGGASWHDYLGVEDHLAVLRLWHERYGAELYYPAGSNLELDVARPPAERLEVARCAVEQSVYCDDLSQILGDPEAVAVKQAPHRHWSFWWD